LDTQAKYDALVAAGIFDGTNNGAELNAGMTREQLAKIVALLKKFPLPTVTATGYTDVAADRWSAEEIAAVSKATPFIMDGTAPGIFNPEGTVTIEQLATVLVRALDLKVDASAVVTGTVSDWAKANVATVVKLGLLEAKTDYTADAARSVLVDATFAAVTELAAPKVTEAVAVDSKKVKVTFSDAGVVEKTLDTALVANVATDVKVTYKDREYTVSVTHKQAAVATTVVGAKKIEVKFDKAVDDTKATFAVKKGTTPVNVSKTTWSEDKTTATVELLANFTKGEYTVTVGGVVDPAVEQKVTVEDQKVTKIEFASDKAPLNSTGTEVTAKIKVLNQYNEDIVSTEAGSLEITAGKGIDTLDSTTGIIKLTSASPLFMLDEKVAVSVVHKTTGVFASQVLTVAPKAQVANISITKLYNANSKTLEVGTSEEFYLLIDAKDQYGNAVPKDNVLNDVLVSVSNPTVADIDVTAAYTVNSSTALKVVVPTSATTYKAGTTQVFLISKTTGNKATFDLTVKDVAKIDTLQLTAPEIAVAGESIEIPFTAVDQFGNAVTNATSSLNGPGMLSVLSVTGTPFKTFNFVDDVANSKSKLVLDLTDQVPVTADTNVFINGITSTGKLVQLNLTIKPNKKPVVITGVTDLKTALVVDATTTIPNTKVNVLDQYGRASTADKFAGYNVVVTSSSASVPATVTGATYTLTANAAATSTVTLKLTNSSNVDVAGSQYSTSVKVVGVADVTGYEVADIAKLYAKPASNTLDYSKAVTVNGLLADGTKVAVPQSAYTVTNNVYNSTGKIAYSGGKLSATDAFFASSDTATEKTIKVTVVGITGTGSAVVTKDVVVSKESPVATTLALNTGTNSGVKYLSAGSVQVTNTTASAADSAMAIANAAVKVTDQYGVVLTTTGQFVNAIPTKTGTIAAGTNYTITAITASGSVISFKVMVTSSL
jgi:hypothetical protein